MLSIELIKNNIIIIKSIQVGLDKSTSFKTINNNKKIENILLEVFILLARMI